MKTIYLALRRLQSYKGVVIGNGHVVDFTPTDKIFRKEDLIKKIKTMKSYDAELLLRDDVISLIKNVC